MGFHAGNIPKMSEGELIACISGHSQNSEPQLLARQELDRRSEKRSRKRWLVGIRITLLCLLVTVIVALLIAFVT